MSNSVELGKESIQNRTYNTMMKEQDKRELRQRQTQKRTNLQPATTGTAKIRARNREGSQRDGL
jgi:hypothetical protein